jgi:hypothetical protein
MSFKKTKLAAALALTVLSAGVSASAQAAAEVTIMNVTSGYFGMGAFTGKTTFPIDAAVMGSIDSSIDITDNYNLPGWDTQVAQATGVLAPGATLSFAFGTGATDQVNAFFAPSAVGAAGGGIAPVFTGSLVNGNVSSIDMRSFFANWGGTNFNQGDTSFFDVSGLVTNLTMSNCGVAGCDWSMSWKSKIVGGPFDTQTGTWGLSGTIAAVPEASTYGMMLAGLGLVGFAARRRTRRIA